MESESVDGPAATTRARSGWRAVAIPEEHGGWGLTAEPALLGLLVAPSWAGAALAVTAFVGFLARKPIKLVLVDRWRHRWLPRTRLAAAIALVEVVVLVVLVSAAGALAGWSWIAPVAIAAPLIGVELWFDMRSRSRRLIPELCGAVGISAVVASIALAGDADPGLAAALWLVLAARSIASIPFARVQVARLHRGPGTAAVSDGAQAAGAVIAVGAVVVDVSVAAGAIAVGALLVAQVVWARTAAVPAKVLGLRQLAAGLLIVVITAAGVLA